MQNLQKPTNIIYFMYIYLYYYKFMKNNIWVFNFTSYTQVYKLDFLDDEFNPKR